MRSRLHEGMTRTQSPRRGSPLRAAALISLCAAVLLVLGWAAFSPLGGTGEHQAQAQTPESEPASGGVQEEEFEEAYAAYDYKNPMDISRVVQLPIEETEDTGQTENGADDNDGAASNGGANGDSVEDPSNGLGGDNGSQNGNGAQQQSIQENTSAQQKDTPPANGGTTPPGTEDVNCEGLQGMQKLICEDEQGGSQPGGSGEIEDDRDGGSGRSGAGEPTDTFRNGGPATGK